MVNDKPQQVFVRLPFRVETTEAERIAIEHAAKSSPAGGVGGSTLVPHLQNVHRAASRLRTRIRLLAMVHDAGAALTFS